MSLNKQQLEAVNQANFPDNNSQLITPSKLREFNTDIIDAIQLTGSYATTGSNTFVGNQTIIGDLNVSGVISASVLHVQVETASVIYSSGSNQLGDELTDIQTLSGSVKVQGSLTVNGVPVLTSSADVSGFVTTGSFNQYTQSTNLRLNSLETNSASVNVSISNLNTTTASLSTSITNINQFTQSQSALNGTFATTGSNTFTGNQIIDRASKLFTNGVYWTDPTAGFNNLEIINQGGGNLDFASLNGGRMRVVNTPLQLTGSVLSSNSDISTSANIYAANLTGSGVPTNTGSLLVTASAAGATITFTKGDNSQFSVTVATGSMVSASYAETASLAINAKDIIVNVKNTTGAQINKGTVVRIIGATGDTPLIGTASWTNDANSANTLGFVVDNIANDAFGKVMTQGSLLSINTDPALGYAAGQLVYLSSSGQFTNVKPPAPFHEVRLGQVLRAQQNNGSIYVLVQNGYELEELHDVDINTGSLANNNLLAWNTATLQWENKTLTQVGGTTTASFNAYTSSTNSRLTNIESTTASLLVETQNLELFSASALSSISQLNASSASQQVSINNLNTTTASLLIETQNLELFSASALISINSLNSKTGSFATTGSNIFRGDQIISGTQNHLLFKNDNGNELQLGVSDNGQGFDFKVTGSTSPGQQVWFIENQGGVWGNAFFGRMYVDSNLNVNQTLTASLQEGYVWVGNSLGKTSTVPTSSFGGGGALPSGLLSSSVTNFVDYSASVDSRINNIVTGTGFATTGSNSFNGNQNITGSVRISSQLLFGTSSLGPSIQTLPSGTPLGDTGLQANAGESGSFTMRSLYGGGVGEATLEAYDTWPSFTKGGKIFAKSSGGSSIFGYGGDVNISGFNGNVSISGSSTSIQDVNFIPFSASVDARINAITGSGGTINTGSFATTGSNVFVGNQTIRNADLFMSGTILWPNGALIGPNQPSQQTVFSSQTALSISSSVNATIAASTLLLDASRVDVDGVLTIGDMPRTSQGEVYLLANSGSLILGNATATPTYASLSHLTSSQINANTNLIFKTNNNNGSTIISGSGNIFANPSTPTTGRINYIGGTSNLFLNGQSGNLPQITGSAASVSGNRPQMFSNIIAGTPAWTINQAANTGIHNYSNNIIAGVSQWNFNTTGNTGQVTVQNNLGLNSTLTLNSPSRSIAQINAGESGSTLLTVSNNSIMGVLTYNGPVSASIHQITQNSIQGNAVLNIQSQSKAFNMNANIINGGIQYNDNTVFSPTLGGTNTFTNNNVNGAATINNRASSSISLANNNINSWFINNDFDASSITQANLRFLAINGNALFGVTGNNLYSSGSMGAIATQRTFISNLFQGSNISASVIGNTGESNMMSTIGVGHDLHVVGTARRDASNLQGAGATQGSAFFGRYNKLGQGFNTTAEVIFAVGTGTSGSAGITRKTGFLIDSGSNTFVEGTLNVSGASSLNGNLNLTGSINVLSGSVSGSTITNLTPVSSSLSPILNIVTMTAAEYALITPNSQTLYVLV